MIFNKELFVVFVQGQTCSNCTNTIEIELLLSVDKQLAIDLRDQHEQ